MSIGRAQVRYAQLLALTVLTCVAQAAADEVLVKNDSFQNGGPAVIVGDFIAGEQAGVVLTAPCDGAIVELQIGWLSEPVGAPATIERAIRVYAHDPDEYPRPGDELLFLDSPLLTPGNLNQFRSIDEAGQVPINIPVTSGQKFFVALQFDNPTNILAGSASVFRDVNGCQAGKNVIRAIPGGWLDLCGVTSGDFVIRAVVDCGEASGACCLGDDLCAIKTEAECQSMGGDYQGDLSTCTPGLCDIPTGACCLDDGSCDEMSAADCAAASGVYKGDNSLCSQQNCPSPVEACCFETTGGCVDLPRNDCLGAGGVPGGPSSVCGVHVCFPRGACCLPNGNCLDDLSPEECAGVEGVFQGDDSTCASTECPDPKGACCFSNDFCLFLTEDQCNTAGADWIGLGSDCSDADLSGKADACEGPPLCPGDLDGDGIIGVPDLALLLGAYASCTGNPRFLPAADLDGSGCVDIADLAEELSNYASMCP